MLSHGVRSGVVDCHLMKIQSDVAGLDKYLQLSLSGRIIRKYIKGALPNLSQRGISNSNGWYAGVR